MTETPVWECVWEWMWKDKCGFMDKCGSQSHATMACKRVCGVNDVYSYLVGRRGLREEAKKRKGWDLG
eukprot:352672-Chlamydomonas_euryale.AAC.1